MSAYWWRRIRVELLCTLDNKTNYRSCPEGIVNG